MIPPDVSIVRRYLDAREALDKLAASYGASDASMSAGSVGYVLLHFNDNEAESSFFERPDAEHEIFETSDGKWLEASIMLGKVKIQAIRRLFYRAGAA